MERIFSAIEIEDNDRIYQQTYSPFRFHSKGYGMLLEFPMKIVVATVVYGGVPMGAILLSLPLLGVSEGLFFSLLASTWLLALYAAYTKRIVSWYDKRTSEFKYERHILGQVTSSFSWPSNHFDGLSYGKHMVDKGRASGVRLHAIHDKYVLGFMYGSNNEESENIAVKLSDYSGLVNLGNISTGKQHALDDLKETAQQPGEQVPSARTNR
jgi:hypothetical protein